ncbi:MAG: ribosome-binding factor A, partial [Burkholderiales bacterium]
MRGHSPKPSERGLRVADQIQRDLSELLRLEVKDP